jgi:hypothetical protein
MMDLCVAPHSEQLMERTDCQWQPPLRMKVTEFNVINNLQRPSVHDLHVLLLEDTSVCTFTAAEGGVSLCPCLNI